MKKGDKEKLSELVKVVMKHKPDNKDRAEKDKAIRESAKAHRNDKFIWKEGDLVIDKAPEEDKSPEKNKLGQ
jgi:hypothetical protein